MLTFFLPNEPDTFSDDKKWRNILTKLIYQKQWFSKKTLTTFCPKHNVVFTSHPPFTHTPPRSVPAPDQPFAFDNFFFGTRFPTFFFLLFQREKFTLFGGKSLPFGTWRKFLFGTEKQLASQRGKAPFHRFNGREKLRLPKSKNLAVSMGQTLWREFFPFLKAKLPPSRFLPLSRSAFCCIFLLQKITLHPSTLLICGWMEWVFGGGMTILKKKRFSARGCNRILKNLTVFPNHHWNYWSVGSLQSQTSIFSDSGPWKGSIRDFVLESGKLCYQPLSLKSFLLVSFERKYIHILLWTEIVPWKSFFFADLEVVLWTRMKIRSTLQLRFEINHARKSEIKWTLINHFWLPRCSTVFFFRFTKMMQSKYLPLRMIVIVFTMKSLRKIRKAADCFRPIFVFYLGGFF